MSSPRILVIRPDRIGDVVLSLPVLETLRHQWPDAYLAMMVRPYTHDILLGNPWLDEIIVDDPDHAHRGATGFFKQLRQLRAGMFDTALMLLPTMRMAWMLFLAGIPQRIGVGHKIYQTMTFTRSVSRHRYVPLRHETAYCLDLAKAIGAQVKMGQKAIFLTEDECARAHGILNFGTDRPRIGIHPGNGHSAPNWTPERYGDLACQLQRDHNAQIVITGRADTSPDSRTAGFPGRKAVAARAYCSNRRVGCADQQQHGPHASGWRAGHPHGIAFLPPAGPVAAALAPAG